MKKFISFPNSTQGRLLFAGMIAAGLILLFMIVNEDGKLEGESFNFFATNLALYNRSIATDDCIVGNAVVLNSRQLK